MKIITLLGGAGLMGKGILRDLVSKLAICDIAEIRVCDLSNEKISAVVDELDDSRLKPWPVDVGDPLAVRKALEESDLCINAVPTLAGFQMSIFEAALESGCKYTDLGGLGVYTVQQKKWNQRFKDAGVTAVIGVGADPGMSNVLCRSVADRLDTIDTINLYWAAELIGDENPVLVPPYSISTVLAEYAHPSQQFLEGKLVECKPMTGHQVLDLPEPWGKTEFIYSPHSEQLTVPFSKGFIDKGIREFTWKLHLPHREHEAWHGLIKAGFGEFEDPVEIHGVSIKPVDFLTAMIARNMERNANSVPDQESYEIHLAIGHGTSNGKKMRVQSEVIVKPNKLYEPYVDAATSMNASISAQLLLTMDDKPGVWAPEEFFNVADYFAEIRRRHMEFNLSVEAF